MVSKILLVAFFISCSSIYGSDTLALNSFKGIMLGMKWSKVEKELGVSYDYKNIKSWRSSPSFLAKKSIENPPKKLRKKTVYSFLNLGLDVCVNHNNEIVEITLYEASSVITEKGIRIGSEKQKIINLYGNNFTELSAENTVSHFSEMIYYFNNGSSHISFFISSNIVVAIKIW